MDLHTEEQGKWERTGAALEILDGSSDRTGLESRLQLALSEPSVRLHLAITLLKNVLQKGRPFKPPCKRK